MGCSQSDLNRFDNFVHHNKFENRDGAFQIVAGTPSPLDEYSERMNLLLKMLVCLKLQRGSSRHAFTKWLKFLQQDACVFNSLTGPQDHPISLKYKLARERLCSQCCKYIRHLMTLFGNEDKLDIMVQIYDVKLSGLLNVCDQLSLYVWNEKKNEYVVSHPPNPTRNWFESFTYFETKLPSTKTMLNNNVKRLPPRCSTVSHITRRMPRSKD